MPAHRQDEQDQEEQDPSAQVEDRPEESWPPRERRGLPRWVVVLKELAPVIAQVSALLVGIAAVLAAILK